MNEIILSLWAKSVKYSLERQPLWAHAIDVFNCFVQIDSFSADREVREIAFLAAMHDIGKATPQFQKLNPLAYHKLIDLGVKDDFANETATLHWFSSPAALFEIINEVKSIHRKRKLSELSLCLNMHHGTSLKKSELDFLLKQDNKALGGAQWKAIRREFFDLLEDLLDVDLFEYDPVMQPADMVKYAGISEVAEWIASDRAFFPYVGEDITPEEYIPLSRIRALAAVESRGIKTRLSPVPIYQPAESLQLSNSLGVAIDKIEKKSEPTLTIIQTPSNEDKTKAALRIASILRSDRGIFFVVQNDAILEDLYSDFTAFLGLPADVSSSDIVQFTDQNEAALDLAEKIEFFLDEEFVEDAEEKDRLFEWFLPQKRVFFSTYGIGTIEETLFCALNVKRFFLRHFGLAGKTVVFDDICAYDLYQRQPFLRALEWLRANGSDVIILTSALPGEFVKDILTSWDAKSFEPIKDYPYLITASAGGGASLIPFQPDNKLNVVIETPFETLHESAGRAADLAAQGYRVGVILNTVKRAQEFYKKLRAMNPESLGFEIYLLHSDFIAGDKKELEIRALKEFGSLKSTGCGKILVVTPIVERRMRIYFDTIISDLAPIDLLIQRARALTCSGETSNKSSLFVLTPDARAEGLASLAENTSNYLQLFIYRTYAALEAKKEWRCPEDCRPLVDTVYAQPAPLAGEELSNFPYSDDRAAVEKALREYDFERTKARTKANSALLPTPKDMREYFDYEIFEFRSEDEALADLYDMLGKNKSDERPEKAFMVYKSRGEFFLDPGCNEKLNKTASLDDKTMRGLLRNSIEIVDPRVIKYLKNGSGNSLGAPPRCAKALEKYKYLILDENRLYLDREYVKYDKVLGLIVEGILKG